MEDKPIFDKAKADLGIKMACEQFDKLGLTLVERFWACHCILQAASGLLGEKYSELADKLVVERLAESMESLKGEGNA